MVPAVGPAFRRYGRALGHWRAGKSKAKEQIRCKSIRTDAGRLGARRSWPLCAGPACLGDFRRILSGRIFVETTVTAALDCVALFLRLACMRPACPALRRPVRFVGLCWTCLVSSFAGDHVIASASAPRPRFEVLELISVRRFLIPCVSKVSCFGNTLQSTLFAELTSCMKHIMMCFMYAVNDRIGSGFLFCMTLNIIVHDDMSRS